MSIDVLFIHSAGSQSGQEGSARFVRHLRQSLGADYNVICPAMPSPTKPSYENWKLELDKFLSGHNSPPILIGHSLGGSVLLKYISEQQRAISAAGLFLVAAPFWGSDDWDVEEFVLRKDFASFLPSTLKIYLYQSRNDEVVPIAHLSHYSAAIPHATTRMIGNGDHTFTEGLLELVEDIQALAKSL